YRRTGHADACGEQSGQSAGQIIPAPRLTDPEVQNEQQSEHEEQNADRKLESLYVNRHIDRYAERDAGEACCYQPLQQCEVDRVHDGTDERQWNDEGQDDIYLDRFLRMKQHQKQRGGHYGKAEPCTRLQYGSDERYAYEKYKSGHSGILSWEHVYIMTMIPF